MNAHITISYTWTQKNHIHIYNNIKYMYVHNYIMHTYVASYIHEGNNLMYAST